MAGCIKYGLIVLLFFCNISMFQCRPGEKTKVVNDLDKDNYADCGSLLKAGYNVNGTYRLTLNRTSVLTWTSYENGFGYTQDNYWAGLANIYILTLQGNTNLQINMQDWSGVSQNAVYRQFYLEPRPTRYRMHVGAYSGSLPDELSYHNNMPFSTYDAPDPSGCASNMKAGWWYNYCAYTLPTGIYYTGGYYTPTGSMYDGIYWKDWYGYNYSLKFISMTLSS